MTEWQKNNNKKTELPKYHTQVHVSEDDPRHAVGRDPEEKPRSHLDASMPAILSSSSEGAQGTRKRWWGSNWKSWHWADMEETGRGSPSCGLGVCVATGVAWMPVDTSTPSQTQQLSQSHQWALCWDCTGKHSHSFWLRWKALSNLSTSS